MKATLDNANIRQRDRAPNRVSDVSGSLETRHAGGKRPVRCLQITARPEGEAQEGGCRSSDNLVVRIYQIKRPSGVGDRIGNIAVGQGQRSAVQGDIAWKTPKRLVVHNDDLRRRDAWLFTLSRRHIQTTFGIP
jgi:hypothetical protein